MLNNPPEPGLFRGTTGPWTADIVLVAEAYGLEESIQQRALVGPSGHVLNQMLHDAGISRHDILCTNVINDRPPNNDLTKWFDPHFKGAHTIGGLLPAARVLYGLQTLYRQLNAHPRKLIIAAGNYPLWALTPHSIPKTASGGIRIPTGIGNWRGSMCYRLIDRLAGDHQNDTQVLPIIHPAGIIRDWTQRAYTIHDLKTRVPQALARDWRLDPEPVILAPPSFSQVTNKLREWLFRLDHEHLHLAVDIETTKRTFISCIGLADSVHFVMSIPFVERTGETYWAVDEEHEIISLLGKVLTHPNLLTIGQNFLYDIQYLLDHWGIEPAELHDTMLFHHLKFPGEPKDLGHLSSLYCRHHWYWKDDAKEWQEKENLTTLLRYNCLDALRTYEIGQKQIAMVKQLDLHDKWELEKDKNHLALSMMKKGIAFDREKRQTIKRELSSAIDSTKAKLEEIIPAELLADIHLNGKNDRPWYSSPIKQQKLFYHILNLKPVLHRKTRRPTINDEAFNILSKRYPEFTNLFSLISLYRSLLNFHNAAGVILDPDGRVRCMINTGGTETFRWSTSTNAFDRGMNLLNVSTGDEHVGWDPFESIEPPNLRKMFIPDPGHIIFEPDLEGADAQIVAWEADDANLKEAFRKRLDVHSMNAEDMWGRAFTQLQGRVRTQKRQQNKKAVHLTNYGGTARALAMAIGWTIHEADSFQRRWFSCHPGIEAWHRRTKIGLKSHHSVSNVYGYSRIYFDRPENCLTEALAWTPQSSVAIACFNGILNLCGRIPGIIPLMSIHDSNLFEHLIEGCPSDEDIVAAMTTTTPYPDPLVIPWKLKKSTISWGDCK